MVKVHILTSLDVHREQMDAPPPPCYMLSMAKRRQRRSHFFMSLIVLSILSFVTFVPSGIAVAKPVIQLSTDPGHSMNGESVLFKIKVVNDTDGDVGTPQMSELADWDVANSYTSSSRNMRIINGDVKYSVSTEFSYILQPRKTGLLKIPSLLMTIGNDTYRTAEVTVQVDKMPSGATQRPRLNAGPQTNPGFQPPPSTPFRPDFDIPERESFFVRAEASKKNVYQGELILLNYALYQRKILNLAEPGIAKFPDFKGFLKEDLDIRAQYTPTPVEVRGESFYRAELIKFAIFPLRSGRLRVDPLLFKATLLPSQADVLNSLMSGQPPPTDGIPMEKATQELIIDAKPLPPLPPNSPFTGGVGQFTMEVKTPPAGKLHVDQPFSISMTITGRGNVKSIEEPQLPYPQSVEHTNTRTQYEFHQDATGFKTFEFLLLPRSVGKFHMDAITWIYFDPVKEKYETLSSGPIDLDIEAGTGNPDSKPEAAPVVEKTFASWRAGTQTFVNWTKISQASIIASPAAWITQFFLYALAAFVFWRKRADRARSAFFQKMPWEKTAEIIRSKNEWDNKELALLVDQWIRERIAGIIGDQVKNIHSESPRDDYMDALRNLLHTEFYRYLDPLKLYWSDLDIVRFSGDKSSRAKVADLFERAQRIVQPLITAAEKSAKAKQDTEEQ